MIYVRLLHTVRSYRLLCSPYYQQEPVQTYGVAERVVTATCKVLLNFEPCNSSKLYIYTASLYSIPPQREQLHLYYQDQSVNGL